MAAPGVARSSGPRENLPWPSTELVAKPGSGQFVKRARFGEELKPGVAVR